MKGIETCPTSEELAAVADGRASTRLKEEVLRHIKRCEDCYETLIDTVKLIGSEESQTTIRSTPSAGRSWYWYASIAAGIILAVVIPVSIYILGPSTAPTSETLARALQIDRQPARLVDSLIDNLDAGLGFAPNQDSRRIAFRLGVRCFDLRVARSAGDALWLDRTLRELERTLASGQFDRPLGQVRQTREKLDGGSLSSHDISSLESVLAEIEPKHFQLGSWAESGRLAAASKRSALFESAAFSNGLAVAQQLDLPQAASSEVESIANLTGTDPTQLSDDQWRSLEKNLFDLIQLLV